MSFPALPLGYCTNVHPGQSIGAVLAGLDRYTVPVMRSIGRPLAAGLWLARPVVDELLAAPHGVAEFAAALADRRLTCHTLNAFPYGDFHANRVKENVYLPDWSQAERLTYTCECAAVLASLLPDGSDGSISTLPLGFKPFEHPPAFLDACLRNLIACAAWLDRVRAESGRTIRLAIEPEPFCLLETTPETVAFFEKLWKAAGAEERCVREHIGVCYDVCHQAVEFEDAAEAVQSLDSAGIRINKVQISCAIQLDNPGDNRDGLAALRRYVEPRYLHQTFAKRADGMVLKAVDLTESLLDSPGEFAAAECWRVHFHVPVDAEKLGPLNTTKPAVAAALAAVGRLAYAPHLEVETYTWEVLPGGPGIDLVAGLARELTATQDIIRSIEERSAPQTPRRG
ncbi:MAG TPA: metabolite traffic protein EboE [Urbifossiella sp.]|nr:metabolite traffic protein EboE [Urbifossiella sp.]